MLPLSAYNDRHQRETGKQDEQQLTERLLLLLIHSAVLYRYAAGQRDLLCDPIFDCGLRRSQILPREPRSDADVRTQILAVNLRLWFSSRDIGYDVHRQERAVRGLDLDVSERDSMRRDHPADRTSVLQHGPGPQPYPRRSTEFRSTPQYRFRSWTTTGESCRSEWKRTTPQLYTAPQPRCSGHGTKYVPKLNGLRT